MAAERYYAVDRLEGTRAVLIDDDERPYTVPVAQLPVGITEGDVLLVPLDAGGKPRWRAGRIDDKETGRRRRRAEEERERLKERDPGGDVNI